MCVNSTFTGFFSNRLVVAARVTIVLFTVLLITASFTETSARASRSKQLNLLIRKIGHQLLWQAGDSTSTVLPVTEIDEGRFVLRFRDKIAFSHDSLMAMTQRLLSRGAFPSGYTVTVQECGKHEVVYGFQVNNLTPDILSCQGRIQPLGCYTLEFEFPDVYNNATNAFINERTGLAQVVSPRPDDSRKVTVQSNGDLRTTARKEVLAGKGGPILKPGKVTTTATNFLFVPVGLGVMACLGVVAFTIIRKKRANPAAYDNDVADAPVEPSVPTMPSLGAFQFDTKAQQLLLDDMIIELTDKECQVLEVLHADFGNMISREGLLQEVWINEGVITGRSLDMFISRLRKKLSGDPDLRITNIHGKGYRLESVRAEV